MSRHGIQSLVNEMKRQVAIALCVLTMCSLCIFELILVTISIRQHVLYDRATCVSEGGGVVSDVGGTNCLCAIFFLSIA